MTSTSPPGFREEDIPGSLWALGLLFWVLLCMVPSLLVVLYMGDKVKCPQVIKYSVGSVVAASVLASCVELALAKRT